MRVLSVALVAVLGAGLGTARAEVSRPGAEPNFALALTKPRPCELETADRYEAQLYEAEGWRGPRYVRYPGACERLRFAYGPINVKPGQNDVLVEPVTIQKPLRDGYVIGIRPNLRLPDGSVPPVEQMHLHHGTWVSAPSYGFGPGGYAPFFAAGEEKTIASYPKGYGLAVRTTDVWLLLYMIHSATSKASQAYITYDVDFVPKAKAEALGIRPVVKLWASVRPGAYPVFNVQRPFGGRDGLCTWPREQCAASDPWGRTFVGQGVAGNGTGVDLRLPARGGRLGTVSSFTGGTLIGLGGHLHPGGVTNDVELVRGGRSVRILESEAVYWDRRTHSRPGGPRDSWDFSMTGATLPTWGVHVEPGDIIRTNATYDTRAQSTYEDMGIVAGALVPDDARGNATAPGVDPFRVRHSRAASCWRHGGVRARPPVLCERGLVTHGHLPENENYGGPRGSWSAKAGSSTTQLTIADFLYLPGDLSLLASAGVPRVKLGTKLGFLNAEGALIYHTITSCAFPCLGPTGAAFPVANGRTSSGRPVDFDSAELAIGAPVIGPAKQKLNWQLPVTREAGYQAGEVVTFYCRVHPFMRGAFEVTG
jgi:hypothetical protein